MRLSDGAVDHLRDVADFPDTSGTRYEIIERVAHGGMGTVYRARDHALHRDVALKVVRTVSGDRDAAARLRREARTIAALSHPGIVPVHDVGVLADDRVYYAMKLVRGDRLDVRARQAESLDSVLRILERVMEAVAFAHAHGVVHRDLKPANIMVGEFGEVLVMDWGIAKVLGGGAIDPPGPTDTTPVETGSNGMRPADDSVVTAHGTVIGTPGFMAPEQASGDVAAVDVRSDVFALGAILRTLADQWAGAALGRRVPARLSAIADRATAVAPAARYADVPALAAELAALLAGERVDAYREGPVERLVRLFDRYRTPILLVVAYLIMRLALLVWARS